MEDQMSFSAKINGEKSASLQSNNIEETYKWKTFGGLGKMLKFFYPIKINLEELPIAHHCREGKEYCVCRRVLTG